MFFSHMPEVIALFVIGLIVFGPKRLPEIGRSVGDGIRELKSGLGGMHEPATVLSDRPEEPTA